MEVSVSKKVCDSCSVSLIKRRLYLNNGSYQSDYFTFGEIELCFSCAGKILDREISNILSGNSIEEKSDNLKIYIKQLKKSESSNPIGPDIEPILANVLFGNKENKNIKN